MTTEYIKYEKAEKLFGKFSENTCIGYDIGNGDTKDFPITANCWDEENQLWWFGCENYDCEYDLCELTNPSIIKLIKGM